MTIEIEKKDLIGRTLRKGVLKPGMCAAMERHILLGPETYIHAISDDEVEVIKLFPGNEEQRRVLFQDEVNKSRDTYRALPRIKVSWRPTPNNNA